jgi:hypothetical protein
METTRPRHKAFSNENDLYEFYNGGTHNDAERVRKELESDYHLKGEIDFSRVYGWFVRVKKS